MAALIVELTASAVGLTTQPELKWVPDHTEIATAETQIRGKDFWRRIITNGYDPPAGSSIASLSHELSDMLASPDPELRDELGYSILASWIYQKRLLGPDALRSLMAEWVANLTRGIGNENSDAVFRRSFSALALATVVARDNAAPLLEEDEFRNLLKSALEYLEGERDLRGYHVQQGWRHATAHTADLLKFIGRSRYLLVADQALFLNAISNKLRKASIVFVSGEDERLARAVLSVVMRKDFDLEAFRAWAARSKPVPPTSQRPEPAILRANQNLKNFFAKLEVLLLNQGDESPTARTAAESVRSTLRDTF